jgi:hypothetical protein
MLIVLMMLISMGGFFFPYIAKLYLYSLLLMEVPMVMYVVGGYDA